MGIFDVFGGKRESAPGGVVPPEEQGGLPGQAARLVERLLDVGIDGRGSFDSAQQVADDARRRRSDPERAIDDIVGSHLRLTAGNGFVTGLGGFVTLPVALPANVAGFYLLATRMVGAIAAVRGYDLTEAGVRSAVLLALVGADADDLLRKVGYAGGSHLSSVVAQRLPGPVLMAVNKGVGFRIITQIGRGTFARLGKGVPLLGGVVGAGLDSYMLNRLADHARREFPVRATLTGVPHP